MIEITGYNFIAGKHSREGTAVFHSIDPHNRVASDVAFHNATLDEIDRAVTAAAEAFEITRHYPAEKLAAFLDCVADEIEKLGDQLLETADSETALGLTRLTGERGRTTGQLRAFGNLLREGSYVEAIIDTAPDIRRFLIPLGPVGVFSASNFPFAFAVAGGDTASAFAAGCPVIVKGHPGHPATSELFAVAINRSIQALDFPTGFFSLIQGNTIEVGQNLVEHPQLTAVGFTGSLRGGRAIFNTAAKRPTPIPVYAEMGSINPVVILPDALKKRPEEIADGLVNSVTLGSGQFCTNPGLVLALKGPETDALITSVVEKMRDKHPSLLLNEQIEEGLTRTVSETRSHADTLLGGQVIQSDGYCFEHTVFKTDSATFRDDEWLQTEHFGPVTMFVVCKSIEDLQETIKVLHGNLSATIHAEETELDAAGQLYSLLREKVGRLIWNGFPTGVAVVYAMQHGGPYPATTAASTTSVGMMAIKRFMRPVAYQSVPQALLPDALKDENPLNIWRTVDNQLTRDPLG